MTRLPSFPSALRSPNPRRPLLAAVAGLAVVIAAFVAPQAATAAPLNGGPAVLQEGQRPVCTGKTALVVGDSRNGTTLTLRVDNAFVSSDNRYIVTVDGVYAAETYRGTVYYSWTVDAGACNKNLLVTVPRLHAGSKILVFQSSGQPGQAIRNIGTLYSSTSR